MVRLATFLGVSWFNSNPLPNMENKKPTTQVSSFQNNNPNGLKIIRVKSTDVPNRINPTLPNKNVPKEFPDQDMKSAMRNYINNRVGWGFSIINVNAEFKTLGNVGKLYDLRSAYCEWVKVCVRDLKGKYIYADEKYNADLGELEITLLINLEWKKPSDD